MKRSRSERAKVAAFPYPPCSPSWRRRWLECSTNASMFLPSRVFDPEDILFNVLAAVMAVAASVALGWARLRMGEPGEPRGNPGNRDRKA